MIIFSHRNAAGYRVMAEAIDVAALGLIDGEIGEGLEALDTADLAIGATPGGVRPGRRGARGGRRGRLAWSCAGRKRQRYSMGSSAAAIWRRWYFQTSGLMVRRVKGLRVTWTTSPGVTRG